jgi:flagellar protein FlaG
VITGDFNMEVIVSGQGRQTNLQVNNTTDKVAQTSNAGALEPIKGDNNKNTGNNKITEKELKNAVDKLNKFLEDNKTHAEYEYHDTFKHDLMIRIVDNESGKVIQEVPPRKILDMVSKMLEIVGVLIDKKA